MTDSPEAQASQTLEGAAKAAADITEGMGTLVAARKTLIDGGFSSEEAAAIVLSALHGAMHQNTAQAAR